MEMAVSFSLKVNLCARDSMRYQQNPDKLYFYLFKADTFTTSVRSCQNFHAPPIFVKYSVIWNKQASTELLQRMPEGNKTDKTISFSSFSTLGEGIISNLVGNRVMILAILVLNRVWLLCYSL